MRHYATIDVFSRSVGRRMGKNDAWIAATAAATNSILLTTDADFDHLHSHIQLRRI
ncbi:MAG: PIN domain-containing protein [Lacipirellulaceae bacterium]